MELGFAVLGGAGYMGRNGINAILQLWREQQHHAVTLIGIAEPRSSAHRDLRLLLAEQGYASAENVIIDSSLNHLLGELEGYLVRARSQHNGEPRIIVYDATPSDFHAENLYDIVQLKQLPVIYFGEKPLFLDPSQLVNFQTLYADRQFFCDFVEIANPVYSAARGYIANHDLRIREMWFWRAGTIGIGKALNSSDFRRGVEGGSLLDKSVHDLAISVGLLGPDRISGFQVESAEMLALQLFDYAQGTIASVKNKNDALVTWQDIAEVLRSQPTQRIHTRKQLPADAACASTINWHLQGKERPVPVHYLSSWIGLLGSASSREMALRQKLDKLGIPQALWLDERPRHPFEENPQLAYDQQEVRLGLIKCEDRQRRTAYLVCNFLGDKFGDGTANPRSLSHVIPSGKARGAQPIITPIYPRRQADTESEAKVYSEQKVDSLAHILGKVVEYCQTGHADAALSRAAVLPVHGALLAAQDKALEIIGFRDEPGDKATDTTLHDTDLYRCSIQLFSEKIYQIGDVPRELNEGIS